MINGREILAALAQTFDSRRSNGTKEVPKAPEQQPFQKIHYYLDSSTIDPDTLKRLARFPAMLGQVWADKENGFFHVIPLNEEGQRLFALILNGKHWISYSYREEP